VATRVQLVLDVSDADRAATFWAAALGYRPFGRWEQYRSLVDPDGVGPKLILQQVAEGKAGKNRMHLDVHVPDVEAEVARLAVLGATRLDVEPVAEAGTSRIRMQDPDGNEFCVCQLQG
jgi:catechol 2,3-dioxygenase-like lactoylglutathione lyase family enzyme